MNNVEVIVDFFPPEELAFKEKTVKITIALSRSSVDSLIRRVETHRTPYQKMIRRVVDEYVVRQKQLAQ